MYVTKGHYRADGILKCCSDALILLKNGNVAPAAELMDSAIFSLSEAKHKSLLNSDMLDNFSAKIEAIKLLYAVEPAHIDVAYPLAQHEAQLRCSRSLLDEIISGEIGSLNKSAEKLGLDGDFVIDVDGIKTAALKRIDEKISYAHQQLEKYGRKTI